MDPRVVHGLVKEIERKDLSTAAHTWRVVLYTRAIAESAGLDPRVIADLSHAAALHDVGKLDIPANVLQKPGSLTDDEFEIIKVHPVAGYARMLELGIEDDHVLDLIRYHHERWDGLGYPFGLKKNGIPLSARYFAVVDAFDAMTSVRVYRPEIGADAIDRALGELDNGAGTRYWPDAVKRFTELLRSGALDYVTHYFNDDIPVAEFQAARDAEFRNIAQGFSEPGTSANGGA